MERWLFLCLVLAPQTAQFRQHKAAEGEQGAAGSEPGERLVQDEDGKEHGDHWREKNVEAGLNRTEMADGGVPGDEAERRRTEAEKEDVRQIQRFGEAAEIELEIEQHASRQHEEQSVKKCAPCRLDCRVAKRGDFAREDGIKAPDQRRQKRQQVAAGIEREACAVETDETDTGHRDEKANEEICWQPFLTTQKERCQERCEQWCHRHDHADIRGHRVGEGDVFQQIVETDAAEPRTGEDPFLSRCCFSQWMWKNEPKCRVAQ